MTGGGAGLELLPQKLGEVLTPKEHDSGRRVECRMSQGKKKRRTRTEAMMKEAVAESVFIAESNKRKENKRENDWNVRCAGVRGQMGAG